MRKTISFLVAIPAVLLFAPVSQLAAQSAEEESVKRIGGKSTTAVVAVDLGSSGHARDAAGLRAIVPTLEQLPYLQELTLPALLGDAALKELEPLAQLRSLSLVSCRVTDAGLNHLSVFPNLQTLQLTRTQITDSGLKIVGELETLRDLDVSITAVTDKGLKELTSLKNLTRLDISYNEGITDVGIDFVVQIEGLEIVWVYGTNLTDAGLMKLTELKNLKEVKVFRTKVTESGIAEFKRRMPDCKIY